MTDEQVERIEALLRGWEILRQGADGYAIPLKSADAKALRALLARAETAERDVKQLRELNERHKNMAELWSRRTAALRARLTALGDEMNVAILRVDSRSIVAETLRPWADKLRAALEASHE